MNKKSHITFITLFQASYGRLVFILTGTIILTAGNIFLRWSIGEALDSGRLKISLLIIPGVLLILSQMVSYIRQILLIKVQKNLCAKIQLKVLRCSMEELGKNNLGAVTAYYTADVGQMDRFASRMLGTAFPDLVSWLITIGLIFWFDVYLGAAAVFTTAVPILFLHRMSRPIARGTEEYQAVLEEANQSVITGLHNLETIKAACQEQRFAGDSEKKLSDLQKKKRKVALWEALLGAPMMVSAFGTIILLTALSGWLVLKGRITAGQLLTVVTLTDHIVSFVMRLDGTISMFRRASVSRQRLNAFFEQEEEREDGRAAERIREILFHRIYFSYPGGSGRGADDSGEIYHGFTQAWKRDQLIFVKGGNGEGKSTLIKLLMGIYNVLSGQIIINGIPLQQYNLKSIRERIVVVPQENVLFQGSIRENLICGKDISREQMEEVCRKAGIHEEILRMPEGYGTMLTENGGVLSGGQKQRLCLARALLRQGDVYIFDEPTSALDAKNRERFAGLLQELSKSRIVVVITHEAELLDMAQQEVTI